MKIAYLSTFYPFRGGIAQFNAALYRVFEKDHDIKAYTFFRQYPEMLFPGQTQFVIDGDTADRVPSERILDSINPLGYYRAAKKIKSFKPELLITKFWMPFFAPSLGTVAKQLKSDTINISILDNVMPHEKRPGDLKLTKFFLNQNHGFIVMSEAVKEDLLKFIPDAKVEFHTHPLYNHFGESIPVNQARDILNIPFDKKVILFFGFIRSYKGLDVLIEAFKDLPEDYYLVIAGEVYGSFKEYQNLIDKYNLHDRVGTHIRYISDSEVPKFFSAADVCVLPYKTATQSGIVGISYHFNLPVIVTDVGGLKEMIEPHNTGIIVPESNNEKIRDAILNYFNANLRENLTNNIVKYKEMASWESMAKTIINLYHKLL